MKNNLLTLCGKKILLLGIIIIIYSSNLFAQTTISTQVGSTNYTGGNGLAGNTGVTFVVENTSGGPINLTQVATYLQTASNGTAVSLWYHPTSLSGATPNVTSADGWVLITSKSSVSVPTEGVTNLFDNLLFTIPNATSYRFAIQSTINIRYSGATPVPSPSTFTSGGVILKSGDVLINGSNVGYSVTFPAGTLGNTPRWFTGSITFVPAAPCVAPPNAGTAVTNSTLACPNTPFGLSLQGASFGTGLTYQWQSSLDSITWIDQVGATNSTFNTSALQNTYYRCKLTCNSVSDTSNPVRVLMRPILSGGTYTINSNLPTASTNFNSFNDALLAMSCGVAGPVIFNVDSNTYTGKITINNIPGLSATNSVVFNGNGSRIVHTSDATDLTNYVLQIKDANYITFNRFTFELTAASTKGMIVNLWNASYNTIKNCKLISDANSTATTYAGIALSGSSTSATTATTARYNVIEDNEIVGGYYGISFVGTTATKNVNGNIIRRNKIRDFYLYGLYNVAADSTQIISNDIYRQVRNTYTTCYALYFTTNSKFINISKNTIRNLFTNQPTFSATSAAIFFTSNDAPAGQEATITNNVMYDLNSNGTSYGIYNSGSDGMFIYHNTVFLNGGQTTAGVGYGFYQTTTATRIDIRNNIFYVQKPGSGNKACLYFNTTASTITSNYNDLFVDNTVAGTGLNNIGYKGTLAYATLALWQATTGTPDLNSLSSNPVFASANFLKPNSNIINNTGTQILTVADDITGAVRSSTPDPGAYEFTPINNDAGVSAFVSPVEICPGTATVTIKLKNFGALNLTSANLNWSVNNVAQTPIAFSGNLASGADTTLTVGTFNVTANSSYNLKAWTTLPNALADENTSNDTSYRNNLKTGLSGTVTVGGVGATFPTITAAINELNANGVCGPLVINVNPNAGPYNEQISIGVIKGASSVNTIEFNGNGSEIRFTEQTNGARHVVLLNTAQWITIDSFIIRGYEGSLTTKFSYGVVLNSGSDNNKITNNRIYVSDSTSSTSYAGIVFSGASTSATTAGLYKNNTIQGNEINGGYYGITIAGTSGNSAGSRANRVIKNKIRNAFYYSNYFTYTDSLQVNGNDISMPRRNVFSTIHYVFYQVGVINKSELANNKIHDFFNSNPIQSYTFYGLYHTTSDNTVGNENLVYNNDIYNIGGNGTIYGIYNSGSDNIKYYHNTLTFDYPLATTGATYGMYQVTTATGLEFKNNSFTIRRGGVGLRNGLHFATNGTTFTSDYNNIFIPNGNVGFYNAISYPDLISWRALNATTPYDMASISVDPILNGGRSNVPLTGSPLINAGTPIAQVPNDINGNIRSSASPYIGAYEFSGDFSGPVLSFVPILNTASTSSYSLSAFLTASDPAGVDTSVNFRPRLYFKSSDDANVYINNTNTVNGWKYVVATNNTSPFNFNINYGLLDSVVKIGDRIQYFIIARDALGNVNFAGAELNNDPTSMILTSSSFPVVGASSYRVGTAISGTINVGNNETYKSLTSNGGVFEYINNNLLGGNLEIIVKSNLTETGVHALNAFAETGGSGYSINIKPANDTLRTISGIYTGGLIRLNGSDRVNIDGRFNGSGQYLRIENNSSSSNTAAIQLISLGVNAGASNNTIRNSIIVGGSAGNAVPIHIGGANIPYNSGPSNNNNKIINNTILRGSVGIFSGGTDAGPTDSLLIEGNTIGSDIVGEQLRLYGMALEISKNSTVHKNTIKNIINTAAQQAWGIALYDGFANGKITSNKIEKVTNGSGAFGGRGIEIVSGKPNENILIANNFVGGIGGSGSRNLNSSATIGIGIINTGGVNIYNNSINLVGNIGTSTSIPDTSAALYIGAGSRLLNIRNNSIVNTIRNTSDTSYAYALYSSVGDTAYTDINYNNYYVGATSSTNPQGILGRLTVDLNTLAQIQISTGKDLNSITGNPNYISDINLHGQGATLYQKAQSISTITEDIDGDVRPSIPAIGADEFIPPPNEIEMVTMIYPNPISCGKNVDSILLVIANLGTSAQSSYIVKANITGAVVANLSKTVTKTLAVGGRDTVSLGTINSNVAGVANIKAYVELATDLVKSNDTISVSREYSLTPGMPTASDVNACYGGSATLVATNGSVSYTWYNAASGGNVLAINDSLNITNVTSPTKYWVSTAAGSSTGSIKISEIDVGGTDMVEIQNLSGTTINTSGWKVIVSNSYTVIGSINANVWNLPATMGPGQVLYRTDNSTDNYWGSNILYNPGAFPTYSGWAIILDNNDNVVDAVFLNWPLSNIQTASIVFNSKTLNLSQEWKSSGVNIATVAGTSSISRAGNRDNNDATDFQIVTTSKGTTNAVLNLPYAVSGCESDRKEVTVNVLPRPYGSIVTQASPFQGVFKAGTSTNPDEACLADTLTYALTAPTGFLAADLGTTWNITNAQVKRSGGTTPAGSIVFNGLNMTYVAAAGDLDSTLVFTAKVVNIATGCDSEVVRYLKVNTAPVVSLGNDITICEGAATVLNAGNTGSTYLWSTGATTQTISISTSGTYSVTVTNSSGCSSTDQIVVTTIPSPTKALGPDVKACVGQNVVLDAGNPNATYSWNTGATTRTINPVTSGLYIVIVTGTGGCTTTDSINVVFNALPVVNLGSDLNICIEDTTILDAGNAGATYLWSTGATTRTIKVNAAGTYSVTVTNTNGCANTDQVVVTNKPAPIASYTDTALNGLNVKFTATVVAGNSYVWNFGDPTSPSNTSALTNPIHEFTQPGTYTVTLTVTNVASGCVTIEKRTINVVFVGISTANKEVFNFYAAPNPFAGSTSLNFNLKKTSMVKIEMYDLLGRKVKDIQNLTELSAGDHKVELNNTSAELPNGIYLIKLNVDGNESVIRVQDNTNN